MEMMKCVELSLFLFTIIVSGLVLVNCPGSMPEQLLNDCIVYEGAGSSFSTSDYAHMAQYHDWLKRQQPLAISQPTTAAMPKVK